MKKGIIITIVVIVAAIILVLIGFGFMQMSSSTINSNSMASNNPISIDTNTVVSDSGSATPSPTGTISNTPVNYAVAISNFAFSPSLVTIHSGDSVTWTNMDSATHTIVSDSENELNSNSISNGGTYSHTFNTPGTYYYHCSIHPSMKGEIIVQ